jgi:hypothetical protein
MNAKFEKWCEENTALTRDASDRLFKAAIQSLEVTPELAYLAVVTYMKTDSMHDAISAVLSALKEQAK